MHVPLSSPAYLHPNQHIPKNVYIHGKGANAGFARNPEVRDQKSEVSKNLVFNDSGFRIRH